MLLPRSLGQRVEQACAAQLYGAVQWLRLCCGCRKRKFNSLEDGGSVTAEDMEAYRVTRQRGDDPLTAMRTAAVKAGGAQSSYDLV